MVSRVILAFLGCWVSLAIALIFCFQQDDHPTLLNVMAHVETGIYSF